MHTWITLLMRIVVGGVFVYSGWEKLIAPVENFVAVVDQYQFLAPRLARPVALAVPWLELVFGTFLVLGFMTQVSAAMLSALLGIFIALLGRSIILDLPIDDCGCFGSGILLAPHQAFMLDTVLLLCAAIVFKRPLARASLDGWLVGNSKKYTLLLCLVPVCMASWPNCLVGSEQLYTPEISLDQTPVSGNPEAAVTLVEFSDFECHFCGRVQPTLQKIRARYGDQIRFAFKHFPLPFHRNARRAHLASLCAEEQDKFWAYRAHLFQHQRNLRETALMDYARELGLEPKSFQACLSEERYAAKLAQDFEEGVNLGISGTPTFFVNGRLLPGAQPYAAFERIIEEELRE